MECIVDPNLNMDILCFHILSFIYSYERIELYIPE